jgi:membrane protein
MLESQEQYSLGEVDPQIRSAYVRRVLLWLAAALGVSAVTCFWVAPLVPAPVVMGAVLGLSILLLVLMLVSVVLIRTKAATWLSPVLLVLYAVVAGGDLYFVLLAATRKPAYASLVVFAFAIAAGVFAVMAVFGWFTQTNLLRFGWVMFFGLLAVIVVSLLNSFVFHLPVLGLVVSLVSALIFAFYVAYDFQALKYAGLGLPASMMALSLFIDFVALFKNILTVLEFFSND